MSDPTIIKIHPVITSESQIDSIEDHGSIFNDSSNNTDTIIKKP